MRCWAVVLAALLAGCTGGGGPTPTTPAVVTVEPPSDAGGFASCRSSSAQTLTIPFDARAVDDSGGRGPGIHRLETDTFLWVWAVHRDSLREDRVSRIVSVDAYRERAPEAPVVVCARVDVLAPTDVDPEPRSYAVAVRIRAVDGMPPEPVRVVVNWLASCPCDDFPKGNATADFE